MYVANVVLSSIDYYIVNSLINKNVKSMVNLTVRTHEKKLEETKMLCYHLHQQIQ